MVRCGPYLTAGAFRSSRADSGPQVLPPARATVPPWLPAKSARVSNLLACCALGRGCGRNGADFACTLGAERIERRRCLFVKGFNRRDFHGARQEIIGK